MPPAATAEALTKLCPDLESWPQRWRYQDSDIAVGERIVERFTPFLLHLLGQGLATGTLERHRDHLWMLGGEIIRRLHQESSLRRKSINAVILQLIDDECGPLIWPRITEQQQNSFDATCRKLHRFLTASPKPPAQE
jgi:hypothetical protein